MQNSLKSAFLLPVMLAICSCSSLRTYADFATHGQKAIEKGDLKTAQADFTKALKLAQSYNDGRQMILSYKSLAKVSLEQKNHDQALDYYLKALSVGEANANVTKSELANVLLELGRLYNTAGERKSAK